MLYWSQIPLVRLLFPFILGILSAFYYAEFQHLESTIYSSIAILLFIIFLYFTLKSYKFRWVFGVVGNLLFYLLGFIWCSISLSNHAVTFLPSEEPVRWFGKVTEINKQTDTSSSALVQLSHYYDSSKSWVKTEEKINFYLKDTTKIKVGNWISTDSYLNRIEGAKNPAQFDYAEFMQKRFVYYQTFSKSVEVHFHEESLSSYSAEIRESLIGKFENAGIDGNRLAVLIAISLGDKSYLEESLKNNYAGAGAMHILAVSGLHVGIVYLIFSSLFKVLKLGDKLIARIIKGVILLLVVWSFALITGLSPSVQRAACMFSFIIFADIFSRHSIALNSIASSAFILLLINPMLLFEVGFQLSYAAVVGIVWMHPIIYSWYTSPYWIIDKAWSLLVVSITAQLATLPFTLYYFHQFPNWFLLTNLGVIPLAFVIVCGALIVGLLLSLFSNAFYLEFLLEASLWLLNQFIKLLSNLPFFVTEGIWISLISAVLLAASVFFLGVYLQTVTSKWFLVMLSSICLVLLIESVSKYMQSNNKQMVIYSIYNQSMYTVIDGYYAEVFFEGDTLNSFNRRIVDDHMNSLGIESIGWLNSSADTSSNFFFIKDNLIALQLKNEEYISFKGMPNMNVLEKLSDNQYVILRKGEGEIYINENALLNKEIILDSSIPEWDYDYKKLINEEDVYSVSMRGFYLKNW